MIKRKHSLTKDELNAIIINIPIFHEINTVIDSSFYYPICSFARI